MRAEVLHSKIKLVHQIANLRVHGISVFREIDIEAGSGVKVGNWHAYKTAISNAGIAVHGWIVRESVGLRIFAYKRDYVGQCNNFREALQIAERKGLFFTGKLSGCL